MPISMQYIYNFSRSSQEAHAAKKGEVHEDAVERMIDQVSGDMVLLDMSQSSFTTLEDIDGTGTDDDSDYRSTQSEELPLRRVSFATELVCNVWERPYTTFDEKSVLFYSSRDIALFRMEYRAMIRARKTQIEEVPQLTEQVSKKGVLQKSVPLTGLNLIFKKASQVASSISQAGQFLSHLSHAEENPDAMMVVDTLYLF